MNTVSAGGGPVSFAGVADVARAAPRARLRRSRERPANPPVIPNGSGLLP